MSIRHNDPCRTLLLREDWGDHPPEELSVAATGTSTIGCQGSVLLLSLQAASLNHSPVEMVQIALKSTLSYFRNYAMQRVHLWHLPELQPHFFRI